MKRSAQVARDRASDLTEAQQERLPVFQRYASRALRMVRFGSRRLLRRRLRSKEETRQFYDSGFVPEISFMNHGYAAEGDSLPPANERGDYLSSQLYRQVVGETDLSGKQVLEVSCGRGAGANYLSSEFHMRSMTALDYSAGGIRIAMNKYGANPALQFSLGDAESLPFAENAFDAVVNVEAAFCYNSRKRFFSEVHRVLKSGGWFLYCDMIHVPYNPSADLVDSGLAVQHCRDITRNVIRSLELDSGRREELIERRIVKADAKWFKGWAGVKGYGIHKGLVEGKLSYILIRAQK